MKFMEMDENGPPRFRIVSLTRKISYRGQFRSHFVDVTCLIPKIIHLAVRTNMKKEGKLTKKALQRQQATKRQAS